MRKRDIRTHRVALPIGSTAHALLMALGLVACGTPQPAPQTTPYATQDSAAVTGAATRAAAYTWSTAMADTSQRLRGAALGSGATLSQTTDQRLWLSLPVEVVFAKGRSAVKPEAAAGLDQVALALRANPRAQVQIVGDPDTLVAGSAAAALALDRAASARDWIVGRGVLATRIGVASRNSRSGPAADLPRLDILIGERSAAAASAPR